MLKNMTIGAKIVLGFTLVLAIFLIVSIYGTTQLTSINKNLRLLKDHDYQVLKNAEIMKMSVVQVQQWLTDSSATGWTDGFDEAETWSKKFNEAYQELNRLSPSDQSELSKIQKAFDGYYSEGKKMADDYVKKGREAGNISMKGFDSFAESINEKVDKFKEAKFQGFISRFESSTDSASNARTLNFWLSLIGLLLGGTLAFLIRRNIASIMGQLIESLSTGSSQVSSASAEISSSSQSLADGATHQASSLEETSSALEELASQTKQNAINAETANQLSEKTRVAAENGAGAMSKMEDAMAEINDSSGKISKIIKVIEEIAFQTNLLALNAAVEAARAGEAGKGFAVVAEEVRNLAQRSATAAKDTAALIEESVNRAKNGGEIASQAGGALKDIMSNLQEMINLVSNISVASREQADGVNEINKAVAQIDKITQQNAANAEETASASEELNSQAEALQDMVVDIMRVVGTGSTSMQTSQPVPRRKRPPALLALSHPQQSPRRVPSKPVFHRETPRKSVKAKNASMINPDDVIPMDDDFKDF